MRQNRNALVSGYKLHWYEIDSILGQGGFGITYLALDSNLDQLVAIKEFLPTELAVRDSDSSVHPVASTHVDTYGWGLNRFLSEAQTLAKFRHPNIVRVLSVFEANNTAYMVMEYEEGQSFEEALRFTRVHSEEALLNILLPLLDGLTLVHQAGFIHRDIKPGNIYIRSDSSPVLLDFGSARQALGVETRTLTSLVSPGYAPFEQYNSTRDSDKQGPWTDIYSLAATMYRAINGKGPPDAVIRANAVIEGKGDVLVPAAEVGKGEYSQVFLQAIDQALIFLPEKRPQSIAEWKALLPPAPGATVAQLDPGATEVNSDLVRTELAATEKTAVQELPVSPNAQQHTPTEPADQGVSGETAQVPDGGEAAQPTAPSRTARASWMALAAGLAVIVIAAAGWYALRPAVDESRSPQSASSPRVVAEPPVKVAVPEAAEPSPAGAQETEELIAERESPIAALGGVASPQGNADIGPGTLQPQSESVGAVTSTAASETLRIEEERRVADEARRAREEAQRQLAQQQAEEQEAQRVRREAEAKAALERERAEELTQRLAALEAQRAREKEMTDLLAKREAELQRLRQAEQERQAEASRKAEEEQRQKTLAAERLRQKQMEELLAEREAELERLRLQEQQRLEDERKWAEAAQRRKEEEEKKARERALAELLAKREAELEELRLAEQTRLAEENRKAVESERRQQAEAERLKQQALAELLAKREAELEQLRLEEQERLARKRREEERRREATEAQQQLAAVESARLAREADERERVRQAELEAQAATLNQAAQRQNEIADLLAQAEDDVRAARLTAPRGNNATERYQRVLTLAPGHPEALLGLEHVVARYAELARAEIDENRFAKAELFLSRADGVLPGASSTAQTRLRLAEARAAYDREQDRVARARAEQQRKEQAAAVREAAPVAAAPTQSAAVRAAPAPVPATPQVRLSLPAKFAIFSFVTNKVCFYPRDSELRKTVRALIAKEPSMDMYYSYYSLRLGQPNIPDAPRLWAGSTTQREPNIEWVTKVGAQVGADAVVMSYLKCSHTENTVDDTWPFDLYVLDLELKKMHHVREELQHMNRGAKQVLKNFLNARKLAQAAQ